MSADDLDSYIALCLQKESDLGPHYVRRQIEWAQSELERLLAEPAPMPATAAPGGVVFPA